MAIGSSFRIVKIIDPTAFVINAGHMNHIYKGDKFQIMGNQGVPVVDPDSGKTLGTLDEVKAVIVAETVYDNMSICRSERTQPGYSVLSAITRHQELDVDKSQITGGTPQSSPIKVNDQVVGI